MRFPTRISVARTLTVLAAALAVLFIARAATGAGGETAAVFFRDWIYLVASLLAGVATAIRAFTPGPRRAAWACFSLSAATWMVGNALYAHLSAGGATVPVPSIADPFWILVPLLGGLGAILLIRAEPAQRRPWVRLDATLAVTTLGALSAALVFEAAVRLARAEETAGFVTTLAYPVADVTMLGTLVALLVSRRWRMSPAIAGSSLALLMLAITDGAVVNSLAAGTYQPGGLLDAGWLVAAVGVAYASQLSDQPRASRATPVLEGVLPIVLTALTMVVLVTEALDDANRLTVAAASLALIAAVTRMAASSLENLRLLADSRVEALTDPLTGLGNRRRLLQDLAAWDGEPLAVAMFDLDGFKTYNDSYGHGAGDALLQRIARALTSSIGSDGSAYRMGGDEFSALLPLEADVAAIAAQLMQDGDGFRVTASHGTAHMPADASGPDDALRVADARMYACKFHGRTSADRQSADVLLAAMSEHSSDLARHGGDVATLAGGVAKRLGLAEADVAQIQHAARLHDIGKLAVPEAILNKPAALNEEEWAFMRRHTVVGERILRAAPALSRTAAIVRSSHERWDGGGYPDGLRGDEIPLGARVVFACDALDAMTEERVYRAAMPLDAALEELRANAGTQFDPAVVEALVATVREARGPELPVGARAAPSLV